MMSVRRVGGARLQACGGGSGSPEGRTDAGANGPAASTLIKRLAQLKKIPLRLGFGEGDAGLALVFAAAVGVGGFAFFVGFEEEHLCDAFVSVDFCG